MNNVLKISAKNVYGNVLVYPENQQAKYLAELAGTKTLTQYTLRIAKAMGFEIELYPLVTTLDDVFGERGER